VLLIASEDASIASLANSVVLVAKSEAVSATVLPNDSTLFHRLFQNPVSCGATDASSGTTL